MTVAYSFLECQPKGRHPAKTLHVNGTLISPNDRIYAAKVAEIRCSDARAFHFKLVGVTLAPDRFIQFDGLSEYARRRLNGDGRTRGYLRRLSDTSPKIPESGECLTCSRAGAELVFDIDGWPLPEGYDPERPFETGIQRWLDAAGLAGYTVTWWLTNGMTPASDVLKARVVLLGDKALTRNERKRWMLSLPKGLALDGCVYDNNRIVYSAPPRILDDAGRACPDWLPIRSGVAWGIDLVPVVVPPAPEPSYAGGGAGIGDIDWKPHGRELEAITDDALHAGYRSATWMLAQRNPEMTTAECVAMIRAWLPESGLERKADMLGRLDDGAVARAFEGARSALTRNPKAPLLLEDTPPAFSEREMPVEEASALLDEAVDVFFRDGGEVLVDGAAGLGKTRAVIERAAQTPVIPRAGVLQVHSLFGPPPDWVMKYAADEPIPMPGARVYLRPTDIYAPTHELADEIVTKCKAMGLSAVAIRGRDYIDADGVEMCRRRGLVAQMRAKKLRGEGSVLCVVRDPEMGKLVRCQHYNDCPYVQQFRVVRDYEPEVVVRAHESLAIERSLVESLFLEWREERRPRIVIDESALQALVETDVWEPRELLCAADEALEGGETLREIVEALEHPDAAERLVRIAAEDFSFRSAVVGKPSMSDEALLRRIDAAQPARAPELALEAWARAVRDGADRFNGLWRGDDGRIHSATLAPLVRRHRDSPVIVLDATLDPVLLRAVLPNARHVMVHPQRNAQVFQVHDRSFAHASLYSNGRAREHVVDYVRGVLRILEAQGHRVGLVAPLGLEEAIGHADSAHFQALRGVNRLEECTALVVVGRTLPPAWEVEKMARALFPISELTLMGDYERAPCGYRMRDGSQRGVLEFIHPDPLVQRVLVQHREAELTQAIDRARLVHAQEPKLVVVLGRLPVDVTVDALIPAPDERLVAALATCDGALPLVPRWLAGRFPALWSSQNSAKLWCKRLETPVRETTPVRGSFPCKDTVRETTPVHTAAGVPHARFRRFRAERMHTRHPNGATAVTVLDDPRPVLESLLGERVELVGC